MDTVLELYNTLTRYFHTLEHTGYYSYNSVYSFLLLDIVEYILNGEMSYYVTDEDYRKMSEALECIYGSCLMPYRNYLEGMANIKDSNMNLLRITETDVQRATDGNNPRIKS